jgi:hypothetical protein
MQFIAGTPVGIFSDAQDIIEIKLWETYLLHDRTNLILVLNQHSVDRGPVEIAQHELGRIVYRFYASDWENKIKDVLYKNRIPVVVKPTHQHNVRKETVHRLSAV